MGFSSNWLIFFPVAFGLFVALRIAQGSVDEGRSSWPLLIVRSLVVLLFTFSVIAIGMRFSWLSIFWAALLIGFAFILYWKCHRLERSAFLMTALSVRETSQRQAMLNFFFEENEGWLRRRADIMRRELARGATWRHTLEYHRIAQGVFERLELRMQELAPGSHSQDKNGDCRLSPMQIEAKVEGLVGRLLVFFWTIFIAPVIYFIMVFIVPTFKEMFEEFGLQLPASSRLMISVADFSWTYGLAQLASILPGLLLVLLAFAITVWLFPSLLRVPPLDRLCRNYDHNAGFMTLAHVIQSGQRNLVDAFQQTAYLLPVPHVGGKFQYAAKLLQQGSRPMDALLHAKLLSRKELNAFGLGLDEKRDPTWALQQLASWKTERMLNRFSVVVQLLVVMVTLLIGAIVGLMALGLMEALVVMITSLE